jgi:pyruvate/2-oxoglutarate dehydrogenase complex dihydrolipoamide acyltransferase (E2) component
MAQQSNEAPRRGAAIAVAAAGLTLAAGVTVGALIGWVRPPTSAASATTPTSIEAAPAAAASEPAPAVAPIPEPPRAVDLAAEPTFEPEPEVVALERPRRRHDDHERREHGERRSREGHGDDD